MRSVEDPLPVFPGTGAATEVRKYAVNKPHSMISVVAEVYQTADDKLVVLDGFRLQPVVTSSCQIGPVASFRNDSFQPQFTTLLEDAGTAPLQVFGILHATTRRGWNQLGEFSLAIFEGHLSQVI